MGVEVRRERLGDGSVVLWVCGELDLSTRDRIGQAVRDALNTTDTLVVDLSGTRFLDASGIGGLMHARTVAEQAGIRLSVAGARGMVERVLRITRAYEVLCVPAVTTGDPEPE